jgi:hypothetical protein
MTDEPTGDTSDGNGDLPDPSTGRRHSDMESLKEEVTKGRDSPDGGSDTVRMTFHVDRETAERLRNAVYWTATPVTLSGTARDALRAAVRQLEEEYNDGEPFPDRDEELKGGNPNLK